MRRSSGLLGVVVGALAAATAVLAPPDGSAAAEDRKGGKPAVAEPVKIPVRLTPGARLRYVYRRAERSKMAEASDPVSLEAEHRYECVVVSAAPDRSELDVTFEAVRATFVGAQGPIAIDTAKAPPPVPADAFDRMRVISLTYRVGRTVRVTLDARGAVTGVTGMAEIARAAFAGTDAASDPELRKADFGRREMTEFLPAPPSPPRVPGATWDEKTPGRVAEILCQFRTRSTMSAPTATEATVSTDFTWSSDRAGPGGRWDEHTGKQTSSWSLADGMLLRSALSLKVVVTGKEAADGTLEMSIERTAEAPSSATSPAAAQPAGAVAVGFAPAPGAKASYRFRRTSASNIVELKQVADETSEAEYTLAAKSRRDGGGAVADVTFSRISGSFLARDGTKVAYDTAKPGPAPTEPVAKLRVVVASALVGRSFPVEFDATGAVVAAPGARDAILKAVAGQDFGPLGDVGGLLSESDVVSIVAEYFVPGPSGRRSRGEPTTVEADRTLGKVPFGFDETSDLVSSSAGGLAKFAESYRYHPAPGAPPTQKNEADGTGEFEWNLGDGLPQRAKRRWQFRTSGRFSGSGALEVSLERTTPATRTK